jgi:Flp pilus assembly protein TadD
MSVSRLEILKQLLSQNPKDSCARYGVAMELVREGDFERAAAEFSALIENDAGYIAAYFHGGQALEKLGRMDEARAMYTAGVEVCTRAGNVHARSGMQAALDLLG